MDKQSYLNIIDTINETGSIPCLGYSITEEQFLGIVEALAKYIIKYGLDWYLKEVSKWEDKIINLIEYHNKREYHIVGQITLDMATIGANCKCSKKGKE